MDSIDSLRNYIYEKRCTLLGVGPMSKNCVDVSIDLANEYDIPIMLIASRRQVEAENLGGGYVNNWSTEEFARYVKEKDKQNKIILCRDHGGPYQNENENKEHFSFNEIMEKAKESFRIDIESGFKIIHIDPTGNLTSDITIDEMLYRIYELYDFCYSVAKESQNEIFIEIGIGKEDGGISNLSEIKYVVTQMEIFCNNKKIPMPLFLVVKTGNHVLETQNIGILEDIMNGKGTEEEEKIKKIIEFCNEKNIMIKEHNGDYLSDDTLRHHPKIGIHAINVAPEFGVIETQAMLSWLTKNNMVEFKERFLEIAYESNKWKKWMIPNSNSTKIDKAIIAGHYVFSSPDFKDLKKEILDKIDDKESFDNFLRKVIKTTILRYLKCLNLI